MSPLAVLELLDTLEVMLGAEAKAEALREALIHRLPSPDEPVREDKAARLHRAVRRLWPEDADALLRRAGEEAGRYVVDHRLPDRGRQLLLRMPRSAAAWLLARRTEQQAWTFAGSGRFAVESAGRFSLLDNPLVRGEKANRAICFYHAGFFERQFRAVVHPGIRCVETACVARGDPACVFRLLTPAEEQGPSPLTSPA
jgi:divinyl protochlorophyllide a 8-vinyl-reductase